MKKSLMFSVVLVIGVLMVAGCKNSVSGSVGSRWTASDIGVNMKSISGGNVPLTNTYNPTVSSFSMSQTEITHKQWREVMGNNGFGDDKPSDGDNYPMYYVSWYDAIVFCNKLSVKEGKTPCYSLNGNKDAITNATPPNGDSLDWNSVECAWNENGYRLPTEAEWEYAARGGSRNLYGTYSGGTDADAVAWHSGNSSGKVHAVNTKPYNSNSIKDMSGNVFEWCWDWMELGYGTETNNPTGPQSAGSYPMRVRRGGCFGAPKNNCTVSNRGSIAPESRDNETGFRVVCRP